MGEIVAVNISLASSLFYYYICKAFVGVASSHEKYGGRHIDVLNKVASNADI